MLKHVWMKWAVCALSTAGTLPAVAAETPASLPGVAIVSVDEAKKLFDGGVLMVDTRVAAEYAEKTIKGAKNVPYKEKSAKEAGFDASLDQFDLSKLPGDKATPMVFFCNAGECWKSYKASVVAHKAGYTRLHWFRGGMPAWTGKGLPTQ